MGKKKNPFKKVRGNAGSKLDQSKKVNPFVTRQHRSKHKVIGKKVKGATTSTGEARRKSIAKRQQSLLREFKNIDKNNTFEDKRFGEGDNQLDNESKSLMRFQQVRQSRLSKFALDDGPEDVLQIKGGVLGAKYAQSAIDDDHNDEDPEAGRIDAQTVIDAHFGGGALELRDPTRSKAQVMEEIIMKSKLFKMEKAKISAEQMDLVHNLDQDFGDIRGLMDYKAAGENSTSAPVQEDATMTDFLNQVRSFKQEARAAAAERLKTPEEIAAELKEKLERLERERLRRMKGEDIHFDQDGFSTKKPDQKLTDEDLTDNFIIEPKFLGIDPDDDDHDDDKDGDDAQIENEVDDEDDDDLGYRIEAIEDEESDDEDDDDDKEVSKKDKKSTEKKELPFIFPCPKTYKEFLGFLEGWSYQDHATIIHRIKTCTHLSLAAENRQKLETFYLILMKHFDSTIERFGEEDNDDDAKSDRSRERFSNKVIPVLDLLVRPLFDISTDMPKFATRFHHQRLSSIEEAIVNFSYLSAQDDDDEQQAHLSVFPTGADLYYFRLLAHIYPVTDYRHNVMTPLILMMGQMLTTLPVRGVRDVAAGLYICSLMLAFNQQSDRFCPEVVSFLTGLLSVGFQADDQFDNVPSSSSIASLTATTFSCPNFHRNFLPGSNIWHPLVANKKKSKKTSKKKSKKKKVLSSSSDFPASIPLSALLEQSNKASKYQTTSMRQACMSVAINLIKDIVAQYYQLHSFPELLSSLCSSLNTIIKSDYPEISSHPELMELASSLQEKINKKSSRRKHLKLKKAPATIKTHTPVFLQDYQPGKDYDPSYERSEMKKLRQKAKREKKGAMRELRKDTEFLAREQQKKSRKHSESRERARKRVYQLLTEQARDTNVYNGMKKKRRK